MFFSIPLPARSPFLYHPPLLTSLPACLGELMGDGGVPPFLPTPRDGRPLLRLDDRHRSYTRRALDRSFSNMAENQTDPVGDDDMYTDMPELRDVRDYLHSTLNAVIPTRPASLKPIVVAFECQNTSKADELKCVICLETRHTETNEVIRLAKCCKCPIHLSCVYKWLAAQYDNYKPHEQWGCPHCRAPVKDLAENTDPCVICGSKETDQLYHEPVAQAVPCCEASAHQQCLYKYIKDNFREDRFPCPACKTMLGAQRSMTMSIEANNEEQPTNYSGVMTERLDEQTPAVSRRFRQPTPPYRIMTRSRSRGRGYQLHRGQPRRPVRRPYSDTD